MAAAAKLDLGLRATQIAALLRLLEHAHTDLSRDELQADVGWLIPLAAELIDEIAELIDIGAYQRVRARASGEGGAT